MFASFKVTALSVLLSESEAPPQVVAGAGAGAGATLRFAGKL
jgi:hypothetical protein